MRGRNFRSWLVFGGALLFSLILITIVVAHFLAKDAVSDFLKRKLPHHVQLNYGELNTNVISGYVELKDIVLNLSYRDSMLVHTTVHMDAISLSGLSYWQFFVKKNIAIDELHLQQPRVKHYLNQRSPKADAERQGVVQLLRNIEIEEFEVVNGQLDLFENDLDSLLLQINEVNFVVRDAKTGPDKIKERIPLEYGFYELDIRGLFVDLGPFEQLKANQILWKNNLARISDLNLFSKYDKAKLSTRLRVERDHVDLRIPEIEVDSIRFGFEKDTFFIITGSGKIDRPFLEIYRDKLVPDDLSHKKLYSQSLRELPIRLNIPEIEIMDGTIVYSEKVAQVAEPGKIMFEELDAVIQDISNTYAFGGETSIEATTKFMGNAKIALNWSFDTNRLNDAFLISGEVSNFDTESINSFLRSNLRATTTGTIDKMYFTVSGDNISSSGDMKMKYEDFKFSVLKKDRSSVNKLLTAIGNIFVNDGSRTDAEGFRYGNINVERDPTKSFFNYLWLNVREGTLNSLTSKGGDKD